MSEMEEEGRREAWKVKVEVIKQAIKQVMEEEEEDDDHNHNHNHNRLLSKLMTQLESLEAEEAETEAADDEVLRLERIEMVVQQELNKLKRQNFITHCLVSVMIVLTVAWQISEVSIILKLRDGLTHPFRSVGTVFKWMLKPKPNQQEEDQTLIESSSPNINDINIPHVHLPQIGFSLID